MVDWTKRIQEWKDYDARLEYRNIPLKQIRGVEWQNQEAYLLLDEGKKARVSPDALYDLFMYCQKHRKEKVRLSIPQSAFSGTQAGYRNLIRGALLAFLSKPTGFWDRDYTRLIDRCPSALFEKKDGKVTIIGIAPSNYKLVSVPEILQFDPQEVDWNNWGDGQRHVERLVRPSTFKFDWSGWEEREFNITHHVGSWLLEYGGVFVRFFSGYTGRIGTGVTVGIVVENNTIGIANLGNFVITTTFPETVKNTISRLRLAWKLCFYTPFLDAIARARDVLAREQIQSDEKLGIVNRVNRAIEALKKDWEVPYTLPPLGKVPKASTFLEFATVLNDVLLPGTDDVLKILIEKTLGEAMATVLADRASWGETKIEDWKVLFWSLC